MPRLAAGLLFLALAAGGCGAGDREARARVAAEGYLEALKAGDPDRAVTFFARQYLETRGAQGWLADLRLITGRLGPLRSYTLRRATSRVDFIPPDNGTHVTLEYEVTYARHRAQETFVVFKPFARGEYRIVTHRLASEGLMRE
jgi:hypothetical protein